MSQALARGVQVVDRLVQTALDAARWLALPIAALLCLQWPLRDAVRAYSREANDLGQILFAVYVSFAVTAATRANAHLAVDLVAARLSPAVRRLLLRAALLVGVTPWCLFMLAAGAGVAFRSVAGLETFPDTYNPGYFIVKASAMLLAGVALIQAALDVVDPGRVTQGSRP
jgi:TRAP-type mannitol/chloroaromatic compound transport system permease small subunit